MKELFTKDTSNSNSVDNIGNQASIDNQQKISIWERYKKWIIIAGVVVAIVCLFIFKEGIKTITHFHNQSVTNVYEIEGILKEESEIVTAVYDYKNLAQEQDARYLGDWKLPLTSNKLQGYYEGTVTAYYPTEKIVIRVNQLNHRIYITLPENEDVILESHIKHDATIWETQNNILNPISAEQVSQFEYNAEQDELQLAIKNGLYQLAEEKAEEYLRGLYADFSEYEVIFS